MCIRDRDKPEASRKYAWHDMHLAYRTPNAIYLYVQQNQAYLPVSYTHLDVYKRQEPRTPEACTSTTTEPPVSSSTFSLK